MKLLSQALAGTSLLALVACGSPPSPRDIAERTSERAARLLSGAGEAAQTANGASSLSSLTGAFNAMRGSFDSVPVDGAPSCPPGTLCQTAAPTEVAAPTPPSQQAVDDAAARMARFLRERVFIEENVESHDGSSVVFRLEGGDLCTDGEAPADPACVEQVDALEVRVRATQGLDETVELVLLIGPDRREPLELRVREESLSLRLDLAELKATLEHAASLEGRPAELPVMSGELELKLKRNGERDFTLSASVLQDLSILAIDEVGAVRSFLTSAKAPVWALRLDGPHRRLTFDFDLGLTELSFPYAPDFSSSGAAGQRMTFHLSGLSFAFSAEEGQEDFVVAHVGIGQAQSYLTLDKHTLFTADLNRLSGRHFDVTLSRDTDGLPIIRVLPELELVTGFFLAPLEVDADVSVPEFYRDETYRVRLSGSSPAVKPLQPNPETGFPGGLAVLEGELRLETSRPDVEPIVVGKGACLVDRDVRLDGSHPLLGHLSSGPCH